ncbi:MAG TPA: murein biosynthesis integral membrane protein MurJ [Herpetosiphonaceae bacterium]|nr:murein biosynthesis integral membrane protein MurJ [Herpetosiphonaceae bacterium]
MSKVETSVHSASSVTSGTPVPASRGIGRSIAVAALLIALGNIASRVVGQVRESVTAGLFGATGGVDASAYALASRVPTTLYDFIVGGLVSAALVPVFAELAERDERELGVVAGTVFSAATLLAVTIATLAWIFAPGVGTLMTLTAGPGALRETTTTLIRWMLPATVLMALSGLTTGLLQARRQFLLPAFATAVFNVGIILGAWTLNRTLHVRSLAVGMILGATFQVLLQVPGLRGTYLRPGLRLRHPAVRRIARLYAPVLLGLSFALLGTLVDAALASGRRQGSAAIMRYATTLVQLALGIISTAVALAALPTLSRQAVDDSDLGEYRRTLALSLKVVLLLILPATAVLAALAQPIIVLLFQQGAFGGTDTRITTLALLFYLPSLIAAAVDQPLIFAFYARKNTLLPNLVNAAAIATYLIVAFASVRRLDVFGLILANGMQWGIHALLMIWFAHRRLDAIRGRGLGTAFGKGLLASAIAGACGYGTLLLLGGHATHKFAALVMIAVGGATIGAVYLLLARLLRLEALEVLLTGLRRRVARV